jgi:hypothetical protein
MPTWQLLTVITVQIAGWWLATWTTNQQAARREARRAALDHQLDKALRDLYEQRARQQP